MKTLFVGGPADGQRLDIPADRMTWNYLLQIPLPDYKGIEDCSRSAAYQTTLYKREVLFSSDRIQHDVMMINDPTMDLLKMLINGYRKP